MDINSVADGAYALLRDYAYNDLPKRLLDTALFGGAAAALFSLATGGRRRRELKNFLETHALFIERLLAVANYVRSNGEGERLKRKIRPEMNEALDLLLRKQRVLYANITDADRTKLDEYLKGVTELARTFEFSVTNPVYVQINRFQINIRKLFEVDDEQGSVPVERPAEHFSEVLNKIVWHVYIFPIFKKGWLRLKEARKIDEALIAIHSTVTMAAVSNSTTEMF